VTTNIGPGHRALMSAHRRSGGDEADFYPTPPWAARAGGELIKRIDPRAVDAWECACGPGHMAYGLEPYFDVVWTSDRFDYGGNRLFDFVRGGEAPFRCDWIVTNPPFNEALAFIERGLALADRGVALLMRAAALESRERYDAMFGERGLAVFAPFCERAPMHKDRWEPDGSTAAFYAWFVWLQPGVGEANAVRPVVMPIPPGTRRRLTRAGDRSRWGCA